MDIINDRFLTPAEAGLLQEPATREHIARINLVIARGERRFTVPPGLMSAIVKTLAAAGWAAEDYGSTREGWTTLNIQEIPAQPS